MGQYYRACFLGENSSEKLITGWTKPGLYGDGAKLMEHSWIINDYVNTVESLLTPGSRFHKSRVVWAGDYADDEEGLGINLYGLCDNEDLCMPPLVTTPMLNAFLINHTTKQFVDKAKIPITSSYRDEEGKVWWYTIHPLPLLTCEGNGRGGGDFRGDERGQVGIWARHNISADNVVPEGYEEFIFDLVISD